MKKILIVVALVFLSWGLYKFYENLYANNTEQGEVYNVSSFSSQPKVLVLNTMASITPHVETASLPSGKDYRQGLSLKGVDLLEYVSKNFEKQYNDPDGTINLMLSKAFDVCRLAPQNEIELKERKEMYEKGSLETAQNNGETQKNISRAETEYQICQTLNQRYPNSHPYDFLFKSAEIGHSLSKTLLASVYPPPDFDEWDELDKKLYRQEMGKMLNEARAKCEPRAFLVFAYPDQFDEGKLWTVSENTSRNVRSLANLHTYNMININKFVDRHAKDLKYLAKLSSSLSYEEQAAAAEEGNRLYNSYCKDAAMK
jgi:hypothetical protein